MKEKKIHDSLVVIVSLSVLALGAFRAFGEAWTGNADDDLWSTVGNWSSKVPTATVQFNSGATAVVFDSAASVTGDINVRLASETPLVWEVKDGNGAYGLKTSGNLLLADQSNVSPAYLTIQDGTYGANYLRIGYKDNAVAGLTMNGGSLTLSNLRVASGNNSVTGSLTLNGGTLAVSGTAIMSDGPNNVSTMQINGGTVTLKAFTVGGSDGKTALTSGTKAKMTIAGGTVTSSDNCHVGCNTGDGSEAELVIDGGTLNINADLLYVGAYGPGSFTITSGNLNIKDTASYGMGLCHGAGTGAATLNFDGGVSSFNKFRLDYVRAGSVINFNGGVIKPTRTQANFLDASDKVTCEIKSGGLIIDTDYNVTIAADLVGEGGIVKRGTGLLTLTGNNSFEGPITVEAGQVITVESMTAPAVLNGAEGGDLGIVRLHRKPFYDWLKDDDYTTFNSLYGGDGKTDYNTPRVVTVDFGGEAPLCFTNLMIGATCNWTGTTASGDEVSGSFTTEEVAPRTAYVPLSTGKLIHNVRDIGGWPLKGVTAGGLTRSNQAQIYRGGKLDYFYSTYSSPVSDAERAANPIHTQLGVVSEIDLRGVASDFSDSKLMVAVAGADGTVQSETYYRDGDDPSTATKASRACPDISYFYCPMDWQATQLNASSGDFTNQLRRAFAVLGKDGNYPAYFHCAIGSDRTGIMAMLIQGLIGVEEEAIWRDYLSSSFANVGTARDLSRVETFLRYAGRGTAGSYDWTARKAAYGDTLSASCRAYLEMCGVTSDELTVLTTRLTGETIDEVMERVRAYDEANLRTVWFVAYPGSLVTNATVRIGKADAIAVPSVITAPTRYGYTFGEWDVANAETVNDAGDSVVYATWTFSSANNYAVWTGAGDDADWSTEENWKDAKVATDYALIDETAEAYVVNLDADTSLARRLLVSPGPKKVTFQAADDIAFTQEQGDAVFAGVSEFTGGTWNFANDIKPRDGRMVIDGARVTAKYWLPASGTSEIIVNSGALVTGWRDGTEKDNGRINLGMEADSRMKVALNGGRIRCSNNTNGGNDKEALTVADASGSAVSVTVNGGQFDVSGKMHVARATSTAGEVTVNGGELSITEDSQIGVYGIGTLTINDGGTVKCGSEGSVKWVYLGMHTDAKGAINLNEGGLLRTGNIQMGSANAQLSTVNFNGGTFQAIYSYESVMPQADNLEVRVGAGGAVVDTQGHNITIGEPLLSGAASDGGLTKKGTGTLTLASAPSYNGMTRIESGNLVVPVGTELAGLHLSEGAKIGVAPDPEVWKPGTGGTMLTYSLAEGSASLGADNFVVQGLTVEVALDFSEAGVVKGSVQGKTLVWRGADGASWDAENVWKNSETDEWASYQDGSDSVVFDAGSIPSDATSLSVTLTGDVKPYEVTVDARDGKKVALSNGGSFRPGRSLALTSGTLALAKDFTPSASCTITGTGKLELTGCSLTFDNWASFAGFEGTIVVPEGSRLYGKCPLNDSLHYSFGERTGFLFAGGTFERFSEKNLSNNEWIGGDIEFAEGTSSAINNTVSRGGWNDGVNLHLKDIKGKGDGTFKVSSRSNSYEGSHAGFEGTLTLTGSSGSHVFSSAAASAPAATYVFAGTGSNKVSINAASGSTFEVGALRAGASLAELSLGHTFGVTIGGNGGACEISCPVTTKALALEKVGAGDLALGANLTTLEGSSIAVSGGSVSPAVEAEQNFSLALGDGTVYAYSGTTLVTTGAVTGMDACCFRIAEDVDRTVRHVLLTASSVDLTAVGVKSLPNASGGRWKIAKQVNDDGTASLLANYAPPGLVIMLR